MVQRNNIESPAWENSDDSRGLVGRKNGSSRNSADTAARNTYGTRIPSKERISNTFFVSLERLEDSGWYWGQLTRSDALLRLKSAAVGTFLLRDSSDSRYLYALSVRLESIIMNIRVLFCNGRFMFECFEMEPWEMPKFDCVLKLIVYYMNVNKRRDDRAVCARSDLGDTNLLTLEKPLFCKVPTLQHLARRVINRTLTAEKQLEMNSGEWIESFMRKYPFAV